MMDNQPNEGNKGKKKQKKKQLQNKTDRHRIDIQNSIFFRRILALVVV
jgi:hypothetical protein